MNQNVITNERVGTWTAFSTEISNTDMKVFNEAFEGFANDQIGQTTTPTVEHEQTPNPL